MKRSIILTSASLLWFSAFATDVPKADPPSPASPDRAKISYALGMNLGLQRKRADAQTDVDVFLRALRDVMEGKPTEIQEAEAVSLLNQARSEGLSSEPKPDERKIGYALGMKFGLQLKKTGADIDLNELARAIHDVAEGKPTRIQESELPALLQQGQAMATADSARKQKAAGEAFLSRNSKDPGVTVLPDGLQYRVLRPGNGQAPTTNDLIFVKYRGTFVDGREFDHQNHYLTRSNGGIKGWQDALQRMKVGEKWQLFVPSELGFGHEGEQVLKVAPDSALVYEMELLAIAKPGDPGIGTGRKGHGLSGEE
jgi:FKBP-type peptidyl-prolyl cis-trans isomerase FklB